MSMLWQLFAAFFKIGLFTFGGGYAMIPLLQAELVERKKWTSEEEIMDYYSIGQCTPGIIAVNVATFIGYKQKRLAGAIAATVGMILPSFMIILALANIIRLYMENAYVTHAFAGIRIVVIALIADVVLSMSRKAVGGLFQGAVFAAALLYLLLFGGSPTVVVMTAAAAGLLAGGRK